MRRSADDTRALVGLLDNDITLLDALVEENRRAQERITQGASDSLDYAALGYTIHNLYSFLENYLLRIAKHFENNLDYPAWHSELLDRLSSDVPGVRPRFFEPAEMGPFHELRSFRHVFRNVYRTRLRPDKVREVQRLVPDVVTTFRRAHARFRDILETMAQKLE